MLQPGRDILDYRNGARTAAAAAVRVPLAVKMHIIS